jgi:hypothetical protein
MHLDTRWEKPWHSVPITAMPSQPIGLQSAVELVVEREPSISDPRDRFPAISCRAEFINMRYGSSTLNPVFDEKAELARAERIQAAARNRIKEHLRTGELWLFRDGDQPKVWVCEPQFWQRVDRAGVFMQGSILDREGDKNGDYVLDAASLMVLLDIGLTSHEIEDAGCVPAGAPTASSASRPATAAAPQNPTRRGRKKGSGTKDDSSSLRAMLDLLADGKARWVSEAARMFVEGRDLIEGNNETSKQNWVERLRHKFAEKYGIEPSSGKTWNDVRKELLEFNWGQIEGKLVSNLNP